MRPSSKRAVPKGRRPFVNRSLSSSLRYFSRRSLFSFCALSTLFLFLSLPLLMRQLPLLSRGGSGGGRGMEAEKAGLKVTFKTNPEPVPEELQKKLDESPALKTAFAALTPGRQRAYILYFSVPKQSKTRESRVGKCTPRILNGKGLND